MGSPNIIKTMEEEITRLQKELDKAHSERKVSQNEFLVCGNTMKIDILGTEYRIETHKVSEDSYIEDNPPKDSKEAVWYLGESLKKLAQADVFIGIDEAYDWNGCYIERDTAQRYGIKTYIAPARCVIDGYNALVQKLHPVVNDVLF